MLNRRFRSVVPLVTTSFASKVRELVSMPFGGPPFSDQGSASLSPVLIIGCGRSGNTLLRSMLMSGGETCIPPESYVWPRVVRKYAAFRHLPWPEICSIIIGEFEGYRDFYMWDFNLSNAHKLARQLPMERRSLAAVIDIIYRSYAEVKLPESLRWGDKTPINTLFLPLVGKVFPNAQYVHIIRDPRAVSVSYVKAAAGNPNIDVNTHEDAAQLWRVSISRARKFGRKIGLGRYREIQYENLVAHPERELISLCEFLGERFCQNMLRFWEEPNPLGDTSHYQHHASIRKPLDVTRIDSWRSDLSETQEKQILGLAGPLAKTLGYL